MRRTLQALGIFAIGCGLCFASSYSVRGVEPQTGPQASSKATDPGVLFDRLDTSHAGVLSADKIPADKRSLFERLLRLAGKPADGQLTRAEFVAQLKSITEPPASDATSSSSSGSGGSTSKPSASPTAKPAATPAADGGKKRPDPSKLFDRLDKNHTGKLTLSDFPEERKKLFKRLLREAGKPEGSSLTKEEFVKAFEAVVAKRVTKSDAVK